MKTILLISFLASSVSMAADIPSSGPSNPTYRSSMPGSKQAQLKDIKEDIMGRCMSMKQNEATCKDMMKSCGNAKLQSCMNEKLNRMVE